MGWLYSIAAVYYYTVFPPCADRVVRSSERYAELFRARMEEKRTSHPYPDVYYVLMLADANVMRTRRIHV